MLFKWAHNVYLTKQYVLPAKRPPVPQVCRVPLPPNCWTATWILQTCIQHDLQTAFVYHKIRARRWFSVAHVDEVLLVHAINAPNRQGNQTVPCCATNRFPATKIQSLEIRARRSTGHFRSCHTYAENYSRFTIMQANHIQGPINMRFLWTCWGLTASTSNKDGPAAAWSMAKTLQLCVPVYGKYLTLHC